MRAYLHIGLQKTGTTSIQGWLADNAAGLAAQGVVYDRLSLLDVPWRRAHVELTLCQFAEMGQLVKDRVVRRKFGFETLDEQKAVAERYARHFGAAVAAHREPTMVLSS